MPQNPAPQRRSLDSSPNRVVLSLPDVSPPGPIAFPTGPAPRLQGSQPPATKAGPPQPEAVTATPPQIERSVPVSDSVTEERAVHPGDRSAVPPSSHRPATVAPNMVAADPAVVDAPVVPVASHGSSPSTVTSSSLADALAGNRGAATDADMVTMAAAPASKMKWFQGRIKTAKITVAAVLGVWFVLGALRHPPAATPKVATSQPAADLATASPLPESAAAEPAGVAQATPGNDSASPTGSTPEKSELHASELGGPPALAIAEPEPALAAAAEPSVAPPTGETPATPSLANAAPDAATQTVYEPAVPEQGSPGQPAMAAAAPPGYGPADLTGPSAAAPNTPSGPPSAPGGPYPETSKQNYLYPEIFPFLAPAQASLAPAANGATPPQNQLNTYPSATQLQGGIGRPTGINR